MTAKFSDLNTKRKFAVQQLIEDVPSVVQTGEITNKELRNWWDSYSSNSGRKIGFPLWLVSEPQFRGRSRGTYIVPLPTADDERVTSPTKVKQKVFTLKQKVVKITTTNRKNDLLSDEDFDAECRAAGIVF